MAENNVNAHNDFGGRLQKYLSDTRQRNSPIDVCETPNALLVIGASPLSVVINPNDIDKCLAVMTANKNKNSHSLTVDELSALPMMLAEPILIFKEPKTGYITILTDREDYEKRPFIIGVELNATLHNHNVNRIVTVHGRERAYGSFIARNGKVVQGFIPRMIAEGNLLAVNKIKAPDFFRSTGLQLPEGKEILSFDNTLT